MTKYFPQLFFLFVIFVFGATQEPQPTPPSFVRNIAIGVGVYPPFVEKYPDISKSVITTSFRGYLIDLLDLLKLDLGFSYQLVENDDLSLNRTGGGFGGQIGDLINGRVQIAAGPFYREDFNGNQPFEFTVPITPSYGLGALIKTDMRGKLKVSYPDYTLFMDYILNLDSNVWGVITACYIVACFLWYIIDRITGCCGPHDTYNEWSLIAKFTFTNWLLFFVIVTALIVDDVNYYANVRSRNNGQEIKSFDDISKQAGSARILMINNSKAARYLQSLIDIEQRYLDSQSEAVYRRPLATITAEERNRLGSLVQAKWSWLRSANGTFVSNIEEAEQIMLRSSNAIFIGDAAEVQYAATINCEFTDLTTNIDARPLVMAIPFNPQLKAQIDTSIQKFESQRKLEQLRYKWFVANPYKSNCNSAYGEKTQLHRLGWLFAALCISAALSIAVALVVGGIFAAIESCCKMCCRRKEAEFTTIPTRHEPPIVMVQRNGM